MQQRILVTVGGRPVIREYFEDGWIDFISDARREITEAEEFSLVAAKGVLSVDRQCPELESLIRH